MNQIRNVTQTLIELKEFQKEENPRIAEKRDSKGGFLKNEYKIIDEFINKVRQMRKLETTTKIEASH